MPLYYAAIYIRMRTSRSFPRPRTNNAGSADLLLSEKIVEFVTEFEAWVGFSALRVFESGEIAFIGRESQRII